MNEWILSSPQFQLLVVLFSTPFALTVAQFGMLSSTDVQLLRASFVRKKHAVKMPGQQGKASDAGDVTRGAAVIKYACKQHLICFCTVSTLYLYLIGKDAHGVCGVTEGRGDRRIRQQNAPPRTL
jgi:hypothetical protein